MSRPADLSTPRVLGAFAATLSYRLEPDGMGTRFPIVLDRLLAGRLSPREADTALSELETIAAELRKLSPDKVVWSLHDLTRQGDAGEKV
ncbi:MAG TPA: Imm70 family immunity protein, partial [Thermoanaerobaculia bacterium]|nr:Imm70 family immunity protein [Thermoanaerobaculia bacterium]